MEVVPARCRRRARSRPWSPSRWWRALAWLPLALALAGGAAGAQEPSAAPRPGATTAPSVSSDNAPPGGNAASQETWDRIGQLFAQFIDSRIDSRLDARLDQVLPAKLEGPLGSLDARITRMAGDFRISLESSQSRMAAIEQQLATLARSLEEKEAEAARLQAQVRSLDTRLWIATGVAALAVALAVLVK
ncbi:hypothetical protein U7230_08685 [Carboxydochorda subterranea]|uniref:DUF1640 domain-containing protein n=1 Tax=Carboxydichorda subterranea TaxID=3109565 RepID=A0ABZ1BTS3_9FIRM|nr:hypothetical protein [Limnochorda sp. L945t]WRP16179.1 hypothetical protein U7230_08685 [Limnochorda sp. L945t]